MVHIANLGLQREILVKGKEAEDGNKYRSLELSPTRGPIGRSMVTYFSVQKNQLDQSRLWTTFVVRCGVCCTRLTPT